MINKMEDCGMIKITWKDELIRGLKHFEGEAHRQELFEYIRQITNKDIPKEFVRTLQKELERFSKDSLNYEGKSTNDDKKNIFYSVEGRGVGIWGLNNHIPDENMDETQDDINYPEGKSVLKEHLRKERNPKLIRDAKKVFKEKNGFLFCEICGMNFEQTYGKLGKDFIEAHHNKEAIANMDDLSETKIEDLVMLCSNCHSMVHRLGLYNTKISELKNIIKRKPQY